MLHKDTIWVGKHPAPHKENPRLLERSASFATVLSVILTLLSVLASLAFATSNRLTILEEHDKTTQEKQRYYDALVIQHAAETSEIKSDVKWIRERMEKSEKGK